MNPAFIAAINAIAKLAQRFGEFHYGARHEGEVLLLTDGTVRITINFGPLRIERKISFLQLELFRGRGPFDLLDSQTVEMVHALRVAEEKAT